MIRLMFCILLQKSLCVYVTQVKNILSINWYIKYQMLIRISNFYILHIYSNLKQNCIILSI